MSATEGEAPAPGEAAGTGANRTIGDQSRGGDAAPSRQKEARLQVIDGGAASNPPKSLLALPITGAWLRRESLPEAGFNYAHRVETVEGYPQTTGWARFRRDGVRVGGNVTAPSPELEQEMLAEIAAAGFPKPVSLSAIAEPPLGVRLNDPNVFVCHGFDGKVEMILQRYEAEDGGKGFRSWTRWDDGEWRNMEPDTLPFFGLSGHKDKTTLFLHEGAKGARRMNALIAGEEDAARFPWFENVRWGHHVGWLGGVHAVGRSDWERLAKLGWKRVVIVADNDAPGVRAAAEITKHFRCPTYIIRFGASFPEAFDLADEWPAAEFDEEGRHIGQTFEESRQPFEYATDLVRVATDNGRTKTVAVLREGFVSRYRVVVETQTVFHIDRPALRMSKDRFNDAVRQRSDARNTYDELVKHSEAVCARQVYIPSKEPGPIIDDGELCWNAYERSRAQPIDGDPQPFFDFMEHLIPFGQDREEVLRWLATLIARRDVRMRYSLLLISKCQGVGKSTLGRILKRILGSSNVAFPGERSIADSAFNGWALGKLLIFVDEIYSNGNSKVYDKLKPYVTDDEIPINEKHVKEFWVQNWAVFIACSNSEKALFIPDEDRRWLIPTVTEKLKDREWWERFHAWLDADGIGIILHWALGWAKKHWVRTGERAPDTTAKRAIISASKSEGRLLARDFGEEFAGMKPAIVRIADIRSWIADRRGIDRGHANLEKERLIIDELESIDGLRVWKGDQRPKIGGRRGNKAAVAFNFDPGEAKWGEVKHLLRTMNQIGFGDDDRPM
jgi:hypothetical protein